MDDLVAFLRARLDEDAEVAHATNETMGQLNLHWSTQPEDEAFSKVVANGRYDVARELGPVDAAHIARHDPARVLAEVEAKRRLIKRIFQYEAKIDGEWGCSHSPEEIEAGQCEGTQPADIEALRLLVLPYADRGGYRAGWAP